jgi:undecaprenyl-diphosphatase
MIDFLINIDLFLFYWINNTIANPFFDTLMPYLTNVEHWYIVYFILFTWLLWKGGKHGRIAALTLLIAIILTDQINSNVLKEYFGRIRPCYTLDDVRLLVSCGAGKAFPSSHAANNFAAAAVLSHFFKQYKYFYFIIAFVIAFSRVYVGVHYPIDVAAGAFAGLFIACVILFILRQFYRSG